MLYDMITPSRPGLCHLPRFSNLLRSVGVCSHQCCCVCLLFTTEEGCEVHEGLVTSHRHIAGQERPSVSACALSVFNFSEFISRIDSPLHQFLCFIYKGRISNICTDTFFHMLERALDGETNTLSSFVAMNQLSSLGLGIFVYKERRLGDVVFTKLP